MIIFKLKMIKIIMQEKIQFRLKKIRKILILIKKSRTQINNFLLLILNL